MDSSPHDRVRPGGVVTQDLFGESTKEPDLRERYLLEIIGNGKGFSGQCVLVEPGLIDLESDEIVKVELIEPTLKFFSVYKLTKNELDSWITVEYITREEDGRLTMPVFSNELQAVRKESS
jgi:hypothetical protein